MKKQLLAALCAAGLATCAVVGLSACGASVDELSFSETEWTLVVGQTDTIKPEIKTGGNVADAEKTLEWSSDKTDIVSVGENGELTAVAEGKADITVKAKDKSATVSVNVITLKSAIERQLTLGDFTATGCSKEVRISDNFELWRTELEVKVDGKNDAVYYMEHEVETGEPEDYTGYEIQLKNGGKYENYTLSPNGDRYSESEESAADGIARGLLAPLEVILEKESVIEKFAFDKNKNAFSAMVDESFGTVDLTFENGYLVKFYCVSEKTEEKFTTEYTLGNFGTTVVGGFDEAITARMNAAKAGGQ